MNRQETLLPNTRALTRATVEVMRYQGKILVRYRDHQGMTERQTFNDADQAMHQFWAYAERLRRKE
jgi:hypothetical protein